MLDVQIFCAEEARALQERLNSTLKRAIGMLTIGVNAEKVEDGAKQLDTLLSDLDERLKSLRAQKASHQIGDVAPASGKSGSSVADAIITPSPKPN
jgi:site-specific recombinase